MSIGREFSRLVVSGENFVFDSPENLAGESAVRLGHAQRDPGDASLP
jgi:hypothetical protein